MGFRDVDHQKSDTILVLLIELVEGRNLPPEWWSSVAAKDQYDRLLFVQSGKLNPLGFVELEECEIGGRISDVEASRTSVQPCRLKRKEEKRNGAGHPLHHPAECFRGLVHRPPDQASESHVCNDQNDRDYAQTLADDRAQFEVTPGIVPSHGGITLIDRPAQGQ